MLDFTNITLCLRDSHLHRTLQECKDKLDTCLAYMYNEGINVHIYESAGGNANKEAALEFLYTHEDRFPTNVGYGGAQTGHYKVR